MREKVSDGIDFLRWPLTDSRLAAENQKELFEARPFLARHSDLDLEFNPKFRHGLITQLLTACLRRIDGTAYSDQEIWSWSLKKRLQGLLAVVIATQGQFLKLQANCSQSDCHELLEFELDAAGFSQPEEAGPLLCRPAPGTELELRLPTGRDQLDWINNSENMANSGFGEMASTLVNRVNGEMPSQQFRVSDKWIDHIGRALEQHDDLMTLEISIHCPACHEETLIDLDLEEKLLEILATEQQRSLNQIHRLALAYHWSEADIMAMPDRRRQYYLGQINRESTL